MKKKKIFKIVLIVFIIIMILAIIRGVTKKYKTINDFTSVREFVEYNNCKWISLKKSSEDGFKKDLKIEFGRDPVDADVLVSNKEYYETIISGTASLLKGIDFRIIDESRNIFIKVKYNEEIKNYEYIVNDDLGYFKNKLSEQSLRLYGEKVETVDVVVKSETLKNLIANNWSSNTPLGTKDSKIDSYDIYFDEGYKVRILNGKVFNIVFNKNYKSEVVEGITTATEIYDIPEAYNSFSYNTLEEQINVVGYKTQQFYMFIYGGEISIYPINTFNEGKNERFASIVTKLNNERNLQEFLDSLTDIYPYYTKFDKLAGEYLISYPTEGFDVRIGYPTGNGIIIHSNYQGKITEDVTVDDMKKNNTVPKNVVYERSDSIQQYEYDRAFEDENIRSNYGMTGAETDKYVITADGTGKFRFYSKDKSEIDSEIKASTEMVTAYSDIIFAYGVENEGIYLYKATTMEKVRVISGEGKFNIEKIENGEIFYDGTSKKVE